MKQSGFIVPLAVFLLGACAEPEAPPRAKSSKKGSSNGDEQVKPGSAASDRPKLPETSYTFSACTGVYAEARECGVAQVPLDYTKPDGKKIDIFVGRMGSTSKKAKQLYLLQGGPGGGASDMISIGELLLKQDPNLDIFLVEHRGVNRSSGLRCPESDKAAAARTTRAPAVDARACVAELEEKWTEEGIAHFSTSNAARDLAVTVKALRGEKQKAYVYGVSYGTYWAHRFLQLSPTEVDGVILDSAVSPTRQLMNEFNKQFDPVLERIAARCTSTPACAAAFPGNAFAAMSSVIKRGDASTCGTTFGADVMANLVTQMLQLSVTAQLVPSLLARWQRCTNEDLLAIQNLLTTLFGAAEPAGTEPTPEPEATFSQPLYFTVVFSELWAKPRPTKGDVEKLIGGQVLATKQALDLVEVEPTWPQYAEDQYMRKFATTTMPVLTLNGDLDVQTPVETARDFEAGLKGESKYFIEIPHANHGVVVQSTDDTEVPCGAQVIREFIDDPSERPSAPCVKKTLPPNLDPGIAVAQRIYGTTSVWPAAGGLFGVSRDSASDAPVIIKPFRKVHPLPLVRPMIQK